MIFSGWRSVPVDPCGFDTVGWKTGRASSPQNGWRRELRGWYLGFTWKMAVEKEVVV